MQKHCSIATPLSSAIFVQLFRPGILNVSQLQVCPIKETKYAHTCAESSVGSIQVRSVHRKSEIQNQQSKIQTLHELAHNEKFGFWAWTLVFCGGEPGESLLGNLVTVDQWWVLNPKIAVIGW